MSTRVATAPEPVFAVAGRARATMVLRDYLSLTKPRIVLLLLLTELTGMVVVAHRWPGGRELVAAVVGGFCAAGGAGALNCWWDRDLDRLMRRTARRPLPAGRVRALDALAFGVLLTAAAELTLWRLAGTAAAALALGGWFYYVAVYTMALKRHTPQNIVIGGGAGAFPVLVGSAIVTGGVGWPAIALFAIVFFWTPPHFWSLALIVKRDYADAGVPMLPAIASPSRTYRSILAYLAVLIGVSLLPAVWLGAWYAAPVAALDAYYLVLAVRATRRRTNRTSARLFRYSLVYLAAVFACGAVAALIAGAGSGAAG